MSRHIKMQRYTKLTNNNIKKKHRTTKYIKILKKNMWGTSKGQGPV